MKTMWFKSTLVLTLCHVMPVTAQVTSMPAFSEVDTDMDEFLSIAEARAVFTGLELTDSDNNGYLDKLEAEAALPGLAWTDDAHEDGEVRVGAFEYTLMAERYMEILQEEENSGA